MAQPVAPEFIEVIVAESWKVPARVWRAALREGHLEANLAGELGAIAAPTLIVSGARDAILPAKESRALAAAISGSRLVVYADAGHAAHWEEPERFAADLVAFVDRLTI